MRFARRLLIFSYGLFTIASQTLLFREFITTFEGNDISVGIFFGSWFLWVGLGAILVYRAQSIAEKLLKNIEFLLLLFLPAFILELILIIQARQLAGVESYALLPIRTILFLSIVVNAPVSLITGMFFPVACRWVRQDQGLAVSRVYIIEAAGSFLGGLGVTVLLGVGVSAARVFFVLAFIVSLSVFLVELAGARQYSKLKTQNSKFKIKAQVLFLLPLFVLLCLASGVDKRLMRYVRVVKWSKLLPAEALTGSFQTAQAEYLYGIYQGQWIAVREGSVCEALPDESTTGRIAAIALCQSPGAKRVLVVGSGLGLCRQFLRLPQIETITWAHCDSEYVRKVDRFIPQKFKISDRRFHRFAGDARRLLSRKRVPAEQGLKGLFDIVILNLPEATSSVLNRYYTRQFYRQIKDALSDDGVLAVRIAGGENIMGTELINLGASTKLTLQSVFSQLVLTPGEETWFIASDSKNLTSDPAACRDRFAAIKGASDIFPPEALLSVYLPDRAAAALENYSAADLPEELLINRDSRPLTHLYSLLLAAKQSEAPVAKFVKELVLAGPLAFFIPVLVFIALRFIYILKTTQQGSESGFDSTFLVFSAGWIGIGVVIVLMYLYQTRFGSLYLHIGVISSLFMAGLTTGASVVRRLLVSKRSHLRPEILLFAVIIVHTVILAAIAFWPGGQWTHPIFAIAFTLCGLCTGCYFPVAARRLADSAFETGLAGSKLETADHFGASAGGLLTGLALVPVLGTRQTLFVFILFILANVPPAVLRVYRPGKLWSLAAAAFRLRRLGYILFGIGVSVVLCSNLLAGAGAALRPSLPPRAAQALAGQLRIEQASAPVLSCLPLRLSSPAPASPDARRGGGQDEAAAESKNGGARKVNYFKVYETGGKITGYIFSSEELAPEVCGFGGRINLAIYVDTAGRLINFHIIRSNETPSYLGLLSQWRELLNGRQLFRPRPFAGVHAVTGATVSSKAILSALEASGHRFATQILGRALESGAEERAHRPPYFLAKARTGADTQGIYLISAFVLTLIVIYRGGFWSRLAVLCFNLVVGGIVLNAQYSSEQIATILSLRSPAIGLSGAFLLAVGMPLLVVIFGNIYCGYICPFGAAQELLGYVVPEKLKQSSHKVGVPPIPVEKMQKARFVKYAVLLVLVIVFFISRNRTTLAADPLVSIFSGFWLHSIYDFKLSMLLIVAMALIGSIFYTRFWCRYLCPAGAFLSLLNSLVILRRYLPAKKFGRCEFGLTVKDRMDCLYCDRCRYESRPSEGLDEAKPALRKEPRPRYAPARMLSRYFVAGVLVVAVFVSTVSIRRFFQVIPTGLGRPVVSVTSGGQPREVDLQRIRTMIRQKKLSDKEAEFYKEVE